jgi:hypothetical protein
LQAIVREAIEPFLDPRLLKVVSAAEESERDLIAELVGVIQGAGR